MKKVQRKPKAAVMATNRELRDMADRLDREADQQPAMLDGRFPAETAGRLSGFRSGQSGQRPGTFHPSLPESLENHCGVPQQVAAKAPTEVEEVEAQGGTKASTLQPPC